MVELLNKQQFVITLIIITYCAVYVLISTFPIIALFVSPLTSFLDPFIWIFIFLILLGASFSIQKVMSFKHKSAEWLKFHFIFYGLELAISILFMGILAVSSSLIVDYNLRLFLADWYLFFMVGVFPYFHRIKNALGMRFIMIEKPGLDGASAFAQLAKTKLKNEDKKGLSYLMKSLIILRDYLGYDRKQLIDLNKTISSVKTINLYGIDIPYHLLFSLAEDLSQLPNLEKVSKKLSKIAKSKEIIWAQDFVDIPQRKKRETISLFVEKYIIPVAVVLVTFLAVLPESLKTQIVDFFKQINWLQLVGIFTFLFLVYEYFSFLTRVIELSYRDIKQISDNSS